MSSSIFVALNSIDFCNLYIYSTPSDVALLTIPDFLRYWALLVVIVTAYLAIFVAEESKNEDDDIQFSVV